MGRAQRGWGHSREAAAPQAVGCQAAVAAFELKVLGQRNQSDGVGEERRARERREGWDGFRREKGNGGVGMESEAGEE